MVFQMKLIKYEMNLNSETNINNMYTYLQIGSDPTPYYLGSKTITQVINYVTSILINTKNKAYHAHVRYFKTKKTFSCYLTIKNVNLVIFTIGKKYPVLKLNESECLDLIKQTLQINYVPEPKVMVFNTSDELYTKLNS